MRPGRSVVSQYAHAQSPSGISCPRHAEGQYALTTGAADPGIAGFTYTAETFPTAAVVQPWHSVTGRPRRFGVGPQCAPLVRRRLRASTAVCGRRLSRSEAGART